MTKATTAIAALAGAMLAGLAPAAAQTGAAPAESAASRAAVPVAPSTDVPVAAGTATGTASGQTVVPVPDVPAPPAAASQPTAPPDAAAPAEPAATPAVPIPAAPAAPAADAGGGLDATGPGKAESEVGVTARPVAPTVEAPAAVIAAPPPAPTQGDAAPAAASARPVAPTPDAPAALIATPLPPSAAPPAPGAPAATPSPTIDIVNRAALTDGPAAKGGVSPAVLRAEVMLDRVHASPGVIDGKEGANFAHALQAFEDERHLKPAKALDRQAWDALVAESGGPVLKTYVLTDADVSGPFYPDLPKDYAELAKLPSIGYRSPAQKVGAKFHMGEDLLAALNPGLDLGRAGTTITVAALDDAKPIRGKVSRIVVDKAKSQVRGYDGKGAVVLAVPATIGSEELPSPSGTYKVRGVAYNPTYYYDPKNFLQGNNRGKLKLPPGPNNPVGAVFIALTKPTYGLHGTPDPSAIDKTASHGCVRMTNWDADALAHLVKPGIEVRFTE